MQRLEVSGAVRPIYGSLGVKPLIEDEYKTTCFGLIRPSSGSHPKVFIKSMRFCNDGEISSSVG